MSLLRPRIARFAAHPPCQTNALPPLSCEVAGTTRVESNNV